MYEVKANVLRAATPTRGFIDMVNAKLGYDSMPKSQRSFISVDQFQNFDAGFDDVRHNATRNFLTLESEVLQLRRAYSNYSKDGLIESVGFKNTIRRLQTHLAVTEFMRLYLNKKDKSSINEVVEGLLEREKERMYQFVIEKPTSRGKYFPIEYIAGERTVEILFKEVEKLKETNPKLFIRIGAHVANQLLSATNNPGRYSIDGQYILTSTSNEIAGEKESNDKNNLKKSTRLSCKALF